MGESNNCNEKISCETPENLPSAEDIKQVRGNLKKTNREFGKIDRKGAGRLRLPKADP